MKMLLAQRYRQRSPTDPLKGAAIPAFEQILCGGIEARVAGVGSAAARDEEAPWAWISFGPNTKPTIGRELIPGKLIGATQVI
ncbi:MAG: hypothetical protein J0H60_08935 [Rhizobiales bacterium]|nr:hypothetical protein [Hyphomicrobiales bacterium]